MRRSYVVLLLRFLSLCVAHSAGIDEFDPECVQQAPRIFSQQQKQALCVVVVDANNDSVIRKDLTGPAKCAELALEARASQLAPSRRDNDSVLPHVLSLCAMADGPEPAACWVSFPSSIRHKKVESYAVAAFPPVEVCRHAQDPAPASCFQMWLRASTFMLSQEAQQAQTSALRVCQSVQLFMMSEFKLCVKQGIRVIGATSAFPLCQFASPEEGLSNRRAIIECARTLVRSRLPASAIATACSKASASPQLLSKATEITSPEPVRPESCMLAAQQSLKHWFDATRFGDLCYQATQGSNAPVECANALRQDATRLISQSGTSVSRQLEELSDFVVNMCRHAEDQSSVVSCIRLMPPKMLSTHQIVRICSASAMRVKARSAIFIPAQCIARALPKLAIMERRQQQQQNSFVDEEDTAAMLLRLCENAVSFSPSDCLASAQADRRLSRPLAVSMCSKAESDAPQRCFRRLQPHLSSNRLTVEHGVLLCAGNSSARAECAEIALREIGTSISDASVLVAALCTHATSTAPAGCLRMAPRSYSLAEKVALCKRAQSSDPALCASKHIKRLPRAQHQIELCQGALSLAPAYCALEAPFGMTAREIVLLCQRADSTAPATCARAISTSLRLPQEAAARACSKANSTLPGRCLNQEAMKLLRRSAPISEGVIEKCRSAQAEVSGLEILQVTYLCELLRVNCPLSLTLRALDQFGDEMPDLSTGYVHLKAQYEGPLDDVMLYPLADPAPGWMTLLLTTTEAENLLGRSFVPLMSGTASFSDLRFASPGRFTLTFRALPNGPEKVARIHIYPDLHGAALARKCHALFFEQFQSARTQDQTYDQAMLMLPSRLYLHAADCERYWNSNIAGIVPIPSSRHLAFAMPRVVLEFLMYASYSCGQRVVYHI